MAPPRRIRAPRPSGRGRRLQRLMLGSVSDPGRPSRGLPRAGRPPGAARRGDALRPPLREIRGRFRAAADAVGVDAREPGIEMYARAVDNAGLRLRELRREECVTSPLGPQRWRRRSWRPRSSPVSQSRSSSAASWSSHGADRGMASVGDRRRPCGGARRVRDRGDPHARAEGGHDGAPARVRRVHPPGRPCRRGRPARHGRPRVAGAGSRSSKTTGSLLEPACGVACARLVSDPYRSPLLDRSSTQEDVRSYVRHIREGFARRMPT